ncbi:MAG: hypothetical protein KFF73_13700 [Cyclobacteriaceae bacterium]|nr:hypothetical protein [Cyclobacteriaceae bacterium]
MMKYRILIILLCWFLLPVVSAQNPLPLINQRIMNYLENVMGSQVGRGECWDLADEALVTAGARFDKTSEKTLYIFGREYNPRDENILPGDIIQFKKVVVKYQQGNRIMTETLAHHTAIVYEVLNSRKIKLAHQNTSRTGRKVGISGIDLDTVQKGRLYFYRPIPAAPN